MNHKMQKIIRKRLYTRAKSEDDSFINLSRHLAQPIARLGAFFWR